MKKLFALLLAACMLLTLAACSDEQTPDTTTAPPTDAPTAAPTQPEEDPTLTGVLYADFSCGTSGEEYIREYPFEYTGEPKSAGELAQALSELTGLDFNISAAQVEDGWMVDWAANSTLIGGLDDREMKDEFFFHDINTLNWFMLDSLWRTLADNLDAENIYYTMDGGQTLELAELSFINTFPSDVPFLGSAFYAAHVEEPDAFACTLGLWRLDGEADTAYIEMDGLGNFTMYYANGTVEAQGYLECVYEIGDVTPRYDLYTADAELIGGFFFDSQTQFHFGNSGENVYILDTNG